MQSVRIACSMQAPIYYGDVQPIAALLLEQFVRVHTRCGTACWACRRCSFERVLCLMLTLKAGQRVDQRARLWRIRRWRAIWPKQSTACAFANAHNLLQSCNDNGSIVSTRNGQNPASELDIGTRRLSCCTDLVAP